MLLQELQRVLAREPSDAQGFFNTDNWLRALRQSRDLDQDPLFPPPAGVPHTLSLVSLPPQVLWRSEAGLTRLQSASWGEFATGEMLGGRKVVKLGEAVTFRLTAILQQTCSTVS